MTIQSRFTRLMVRLAVPAAAAIALASACTSSAVTAPQTGRNCGTVSMLGSNPPSGAAALQAEQCFSGAYAICQAATLTVESHGVDVTSTTTFSIHDGSPCGISGTTETVFVPTRHVTSTFTCARLTQKDGGLLFVSCGSAGDVFVPAPTI